MDGQKLHLYLKSKGYTQIELLKMSTFSKGKMYNLFKQNVISEMDRKIIIKDFALPSGFFDNNDSGKGVVSYSEKNINYGDENWKEKYYELLEKYNACLEERQKDLEENKSKVHYSDRNVNK